MSVESRILIVDDDEDILVASKLLLKRHFTEVVICNRPEQIPELMDKLHFDVILLDMNFGPGESSCQQGFSWLKQILEIDPQAVVILITAHGAINLAVDAMRLGATDFVAKPWQNEKLVATVSSACQLRHSRNEASRLQKTNKVLSDAIIKSDAQPMIGSSAGLSKVKQIIKKAAATEANMLLLGENGTGKEMLARTIHANSLRADKVFMSIDLGAVPESLFESELFGHKKGAFTGAKEDRIGKLEAAHGGTLFLDEVGNLPLHLQTRLLTVLEQRQVVPLGSNQAQDIDIRLLSATNLSPEKLHDESHFRQDLLFRLNTVEVVLPPLRERKEDIEAIAHHYLEVFARKYHKTALQLQADTLQALMAYHWPGNIRELKHALERAVILAEGNEIGPDDLQLQKTIPGNQAVDIQQQDLNLDRIEKQTIQQALRKHKYNISHTAKTLGLTRAALYRRMEKHDL